MELFQVKFKEEATELIEGIERSLLLMETNMDDPTLVEEVFRNMHTLKGNSSMFGFKLIAAFTHHLESIYDLVRCNEIRLSREILDMSFRAMDHLSLLVNKQSLLTERDMVTHQEISSAVVSIINTIKTNMGAGKPAPGESTGFHIRFTPFKGFFVNGSNPLTLINELHQFGSCRVVANTAAIPALEDCMPENCYTSWDIHIATSANPVMIKQVFAFVEDRCELEITAIQEIPGSQAPEQSTPYSQDPDAVRSNGPDNSRLNKKQLISSIRVPSERLDSLMSLVSELMTMQAKLGTLTGQNPQPELLALTENLEKISTRLRDNAFSMCLVPLEHIITPFHRLVRDLAAELNKEIEFITEGTETELDKNIMEGLSDPLMHLLRNSIDHGIEDPEQRVMSGKPRHGKILFRAFCAGTNVYIEIQDDGRGIDMERIRSKAIQKGLVEKNEQLTEKELLNFIFLPGFSTAEQVSGISGRGVGMDVVKRKITDIRGQIKISSTINTGTNITIKLPITVSTVDGLLVKVNDADFVIPLSAVERCYELPSMVELNRFNNLVVLDGEQIPFISLVEEFDGIENNADSREIVIVYYDDREVGLIVDRVVGKFQAVLKPLGRYFVRMDMISGATILGDGKIALVLDTNNVAEQYLNKKNYLYAGSPSNSLLSHV
jgi:two-component system chemotaxis sensor kinase CheA